MHSQKLHILNIPELDKIFIEIKDYFNFDVHYINEKKDLIKKIDENKKFLANSIILVNQKDLSSLKGKTDEKQIHCITKFPIKISNLIDQLNARFIQQNYSAQSNININKYTLDINSRILKNFHLFFVENSNILKQISEYNNNIIESYTSTDQ